MDGGKERMAETKKRDILLQKIDTHLRKTARQLVKFDTLDETLQCILDSFWGNFSCDYVSIILKSGDHLNIKIEKGEVKHLSNSFPIHLESCSQNFLRQGLSYYSEFHEQPCLLLQSIRAEGFPNWFTVPIKEKNSNPLGFCIIAYRNVVPFVYNGENGERLFAEFSEDLALAIETAIKKENEKKKMKGMEWLKENLYLGASLDQLIENVVERAGKFTEAESTYIYLFDEERNCLLFHPPSYGPMLFPKSIPLNDNYKLSNIFPYLEKGGGTEISIPLITNLKMVGVIHVAKKNGMFNSDDLEFLQFLSSYVSVLIENARLYRNELEDKIRLEKLMVHHQELVKQTLLGEGFIEITKSLSQIIQRTVILMDRFFRPISYTFMELDDVEQTIKLIEGHKQKIIEMKRPEHWISLGKSENLGIWKVIGGGDLLGYLCIKISEKDLDMVMKMTVNHSLNVFAIQFIKQKLIFDVKEQVKDGFINQLFVEKINDKSRLRQYSNIFNLDIYDPHQIGVLSFEYNQVDNDERDLLDQETKKSWIWELVRENLSQFDPSLSLSRREGHFIFIVPEKKLKENNKYWESIYNQVKKLVLKHLQGVDVFLGISETTSELEDYYSCYRQALQALKVVINNNMFSTGYLAFDNLGVYTILDNLQDTYSAELFLKKYLQPLLESNIGKNSKDMFNTLRVYLQMNGNVKDTSEKLFLHRNSLKYRMEKIREILKLDIDNAEVRFHLMLAYALYDLYNFKK